MRSVFDHLGYILSGTVRPELSSVDSILKSAETLADFSAGGFMNVMLQKSSTLELGYLVYEKIGNDAKAEELASFQLKFTRFPFPKSNAHRALGRILQRRGEEDAAAAHFDKASEAAHLCRCPFLALIAGKDMGGEPGEAIIATACEKMGKTRSSYVECGFLSA